MWHERQSNPYRSVRRVDPVDARLSSDMDGVLRLLLRLVRGRPADAGDPGGSGLEQGSDRQSQYRSRRCDDHGAPADRTALRSLRTAAHLHLAARSRCAPRDGHRSGTELRSFPVFPVVHRCDRRLLRHLPDAHLEDVCSQRRRDGQRHRGRLGQRGGVARRRS